MQETTVITKDKIKNILQDMGIQKGMLLLVEVDCSMIGYIVGGAQTLIDALKELIGYEGTILVPAFTPQLLDPACSHIPFVRSEWSDIRKAMPAFDHRQTLPLKHEVFENQFLRGEGVARSFHPLFSFAAWGKYAKLLCDRHSLHFAFSKDSPLGKLHELNGYVLQIGKQYQHCNIFYLSKYYNHQSAIRVLRAPIEQNHEVRWKDLLEVELSNRGFKEIGHLLEEQKKVKKASVHKTEAVLFSARDAILTANAFYLNMEGQKLNKLL